MKHAVRPNRRTARRLAIGAAVVAALAGMNGPALYRFGSEQYHEYKINKPEYKAENGHWDVLDVPGGVPASTRSTPRCCTPARCC